MKDYPIRRGEHRRRVIADPRNAGPLGPDGVFTEIEGHHIFWDPGGVVHSVEGADLYPGVRLWTLCKIVVPDGGAFITDAGPDPVVTCPGVQDE